MPSYIKMLKLEGHEEGGYFAVFYSSTDKVIPLSKRYNNSQKKERIERSAGSSIYFLLERQGFSAWHRLKSDEIWHYYDGGSPIDIHVIKSNGQLTTYVLGNPSLTENASFQIVVEAGVWFAAEVRDKSSFGLVGCTVSPAFEYEDFELAESRRDELVKQYPNLTPMIDKFIKPNVLKSNKHAYDHMVSFTRNKLSAIDYIQKLKLEKHQEGGHYKVNYTASDLVIPLAPRYSGKEINITEKEDAKDTYRSAGSSIYFLLDKSERSSWHQLRSDEIWHYYDGSPIDTYVIEKSGRLKTLTLGNPLLTPNASFQIVFKADEWFAAEVRDKTSFGLIGCTVSPGFEFRDYIAADTNELAAQYPEHESIITRLSKPTPTYSKSWTKI